MSSKSTIPALVNACRPLLVTKNLLVYVPLLAAHGPFVRSTLMPATITFVAFAALASAVYLINDILDADADRSHPAKRDRPVAAGRLSSRMAWTASTLLILAATALVTLLDVPARVGLVLALYLALALLYTLVVKRMLLLDVFVLTALTMARILAGGEATGIRISPWLMAFAGFLFLSLAFLKRYGELHVRNLDSQARVPGRAYRGLDLPLLRTAGLASGYAAMLILALYVNGNQAALLYPRPAWLWLACPALLYWITRMWILVNRGDAVDDPVVLAVRDPASYAVAVWVLAVAAAAAR